MASKTSTGHPLLANVSAAAKPGRAGADHGYAECARRHVRAG
jgi:hypothetical protein